MDELLGRQMPHSLEAEQAVLGSILIDSRCVAEVIGALRPEDFYQEQNRVIFETIYSMFNFSQVIDPVTVLDKLKERGVYDEKTSVPYIMQLMEITPTAANVMQYAEIVRDKALLRNVATAASEITQTVYDGVGTAQDILEAAEKKIFALRKGRGSESLEHIGTVLLKVYDRLNELALSGRERRWLQFAEFADSALFEREVGAPPRFGISFVGDKRRQHYVALDRAVFEQEAVLHHESHRPAEPALLRSAEPFNVISCNDNLARCGLLQAGENAQNRALS